MNADHKQPLIQVSNLTKHYPSGKNILRAIENLSFTIYSGETLGLVGESGCGKSTTGRTLLRLEEPTHGEVLFKGKKIFDLKSKELLKLRQQAQIIFQDPFASLNPRMTAGDIIVEPMHVHRLPSKKERLDELLHLVGLSSSMKGKFPHEFSGGQRQRISIARALAINPEFIVCDEPLSALDVSVQAQIVNLLKKLQNERNLTYLFISHDLRMVKYLSTRVAVMYLGHFMELAFSEELYANPMHPYTQALLSAIPLPNPVQERNRSRIFLNGDVPSPLFPPKGCVFSTRCPRAQEVCKHLAPQWKEYAPSHFAACHFIPNIIS